jgi:twitching motility protein PilT
VVLTEEECNKLIFSLLNNSQRKHLEQNWELDCSYGLRGVARFRVNVYRQRGTYAACLRALGDSIPALANLGLPPVVEETSRKPKGLILVTGPTGSGKTTTLAALLNHINQTRAEHILTIEDPIEFTYKNEKSVIHQREVNEDTRSFANALRAALREDPDVILVGELRDLETIQLAISAAETGHLVFGTLHTSSAAQTVDRMVDVFPPGQQTQIRVQLSGSLLAVFSQTLCKRVRPLPGQFGRVMAQEIMINTPAIANLIREGKTAQIYSQIQTGAKEGMLTLDRALANLVQEEAISHAEALLKTTRPEELERLLNQG